MTVVLTDERPLALPLILGLAPDAATSRGAELLAEGESWAERGASSVATGRLLWAAFPDGRRPDIHTAILLPHLAARCTCAAVRFPCRHLIALLLRDHDGPAEAGEPPLWAAGWPDALARTGRATTTPQESPDRRIAIMAAGLADMARWLGDQAGRGLAALPGQGRKPWQDAANRLVDAYAPGAARELRALAAIPGSGPEWPERLLPRMGRLALLAEGFQRLDELPPGERGDLLAAAGLTPRLGDDRVDDTWLVVGRRLEGEGRQTWQRVWLRGRRSGRRALLEEYRPRPRQEGLCLPVGAVFAGELGFPPSAWPLAAQALSPLTLAGPLDGVGNGHDLSGQDIGAAVAEYAAARAANPWLTQYPLHLSGVIAEPAHPWRLRDRAGRLLPLPVDFGHGWNMLALAGDRPLELSGEWDGATLTPLSVRQTAGDAYWRDMAGWKALS